MDSRTDQQLLREYSASRSENAFSELVCRHVDFVHSAAVRMVRDPHYAEDVTQAVFLALAQAADKLADRPILSGWLHRTAQNLAANTVRSEVRRRNREQEAVAMNDLLANEPTSWEQIAPHLDSALAELNETDRDALFLRYFQCQSAREMAGVLGTSEEAAQKRVNRAVDRLRAVLLSRGIAAGASGLAIVLSANAVQPAPAGLVAAISAAATLAGAAAKTSAIIATTHAAAMTTLQKTLVTLSMAAAVGTGIYEARQAAHWRTQAQSLQQQQSRLVDQNRLLQEQRDAATNRAAASAAQRTPIPRLPAPTLPSTAAPAKSASEGSRSNDTIARVLRGENPPQLTAAQVEPYLKENQRNAASLLAAFHSTGDEKLLLEAMQKHPENPQVAFAAVFRKDSSTEERRQWLDAFKKSAPGNALANYLSAQDYFKSGATDRAVQELVAASGKQQFQDYSWDFGQNAEEAYRTAGYSEAESKTITSLTQVLPHLSALNDLHQNFVALADSYRQAGDPASAQAALHMDANLGQQLSGLPGNSLVAQLVGLSIERLALKAMDPQTPYGSAGQTAQERQSQLAQQQAALDELTRQFDGLQQKATSQDWISYKDRWRAFGEEAAARWFVQKYGNP